MRDEDNDFEGDSSFGEAASDKVFHSEVAQGLRNSFSEKFDLAKREVYSTSRGW